MGLTGEVRVLSLSPCLLCKVCLSHCLPYHLSIRFVSLYVLSLWLPPFLLIIFPRPWKCPWPDTLKVEDALLPHTLALFFLISMGEKAKTCAKGGWSWSKSISFWHHLEWDFADLQQWKRLEATLSERRQQNSCVVLGWRSWLSRYLALTVNSLHSCGFWFWFYGKR